MSDLVVNFIEKVKDFLLSRKKHIVAVYIVFLTAGLIFSYFFRPVVVSGSSMLPTLTNDETVFIKRLVDSSDIHRGDIIVFRSPLNDKELLIKRVIAVAGDSVAIDGGKVFVNGKLLHEPYINGVKSHETIPLVKVPEGCYYVLGDNRVLSSDSREFGFVRFKDIYGKLVFKGEAGSTK